MARDDGTATSRLISELLTNAPAFSFAQLVTLLEAVSRDSIPIGHLGPPEREGVRLRVNPSMAFPPADVDCVSAPGESAHGPSKHFEVAVNFLGLTGSATPLPPHYAEEILWDGDEEGNVRDFLDLFHHRLLSLFYRSWKKYRYYIQYQPGGTDAYSRWLLSLIGLGHLRLDRDTTLDGDRLLSYLGLLSMRSHSASALTGIVSHYFGGVRVHITQCVPREVDVPRYQRNALGVANTSLGDSLVLGARGVDRGSKFRLTLGPLGNKEFFAFVPGGEHFRPLRELISLVMSGLLEFDVELVTQADQVPRLALAADCPCRLGWSSWLGNPAEQQLCVLQSGQLAA